MPSRYQASLKHARSYAEIEKSIGDPVWKEYLKMLEGLKRKFLST